MVRGRSFEANLDLIFAYVVFHFHARVAATRGMSASSKSFDERGFRISKANLYEVSTQSCWCVEGGEGKGKGNEGEVIVLSITSDFRRRASPNTKRRSIEVSSVPRSMEECRICLEAEKTSMWIFGLDMGAFIWSTCCVQPFHRECRSRWNGSCPWCRHGPVRPARETQSFDSLDPGAGFRMVFGQIIHSSDVDSFDLRDTDTDTDEESEWTPADARTGPSNAHPGVRTRASARR